MTVLGGGEPARMIGEMTLGELVVHGWDLSVVTGMPFDCPREVGEWVLRSMAPRADGTESLAPSWSHGRAAGQRPARHISVRGVVSVAGD